MSIGTRVRVVKGRSAPIGTEGVVFWARVQKYGARKNGKAARVTTRLGIKRSDAKDAEGAWCDVVWSYSDNVEVLPSVLEDTYAVNESDEVPF